MTCRTTFLTQAIGLSLVLAARAASTAPASDSTSAPASALAPAPASASSSGSTSAPGPGRAPDPGPDPAMPLASAPSAANAKQARKPPARLYTNADLERVHPFVAETGVTSIPAAADGGGRALETEVGPRRPARRGEAYWRAEAARVHERVRALEERAAALRGRIAERAREPEVFGRRRSSSGGSGTASLQASLAAVERRILKTEDDLEERARRDGALPGWLR